MGREARADCIALLTEALRARQMDSGGWAYRGSAQESIEATCLAAVAFMPDTDSRSAAIAFLLRSQLGNGSWPVFRGDSEASWTTTLAVCTLNVAGDFATQRDKAARWLITNRGREGHWLWRWKFKTLDRAVRFDPDKHGWPWSPDTASWVIPTAFSLVALKQFTACNRSEASEKRIALGVEMLLDRECLDGGWNAGNSVVYGSPLRPHVEATAIALLALQDEPHSAAIRRALEWLKLRSASIRSVDSLAWCILSLFVYQEQVATLKDALAIRLLESIDNQNTATLATALLALKCGEMIHPFEVVR
jgi:hypothetical protein